MEPQTVEEALNAPDADKWKEALEKEYSDLMRNYAHGNVVRHRARITIKGCQQRYGVDFWETYSPVVAQEAVKFVLLLALHLDLSCKHVDFVTAFLNGPIVEAEIYMEIPDYFDDGSGRVCKLLRSLYGLKQAPMIWYQTLDKHLRACGFKRCKMDGTDENIELVLSELRAKFKLKDLGPVKDLLHMEIEYVPGQVLWMSQRGYIDKVLKRFGMENCRPVSTPQVLGNQPEPVEEGQAGVNDPNVPKYMSKYTREHYVMAKRVLRYLQGTRDYGLLWEKPASPDLHFTAYADADLGGEKDDRQSITGYVLQMNGCTYAYKKSHKQSITYDDTCSSEFVAAAECSVMIVWTHNLCEELKLHRRHPTVLYQDNQSAIKVIKSTKGNYKVKGVDLKFHRIKDLYERGDFDIVYCPTKEMLADILTKPLGSTQFAKLRERLNVVPLPRIECSAKEA
ncbi:Methylmalonate-semialdehyde dehydrogenase [Phytophthora megakarya]|uniref:Methylmalonate-semialdehyde dehydrogenase n=1 Tax=Phytophthora megakarya TaxID=4795 RepID=A0A225VHX8_9STRA|nr:Methylmalonate-semialdehyde dehydrogenase [Phytophthora megakarya]